MPWHLFSIWFQKSQTVGILKEYENEILTNFKCQFLRYQSTYVWILLFGQVVCTKNEEQMMNIFQFWFQQRSLKWKHAKLRIDNEKTQSCWTFDIRKQYSLLVKPNKIWLKDTTVTIWMQSDLLLLLSLNKSAQRCKQNEIICVNSTLISQKPKLAREKFRDEGSFVGAYILFCFYMLIFFMLS